MGGCTLASIAKRYDKNGASTCTILHHSGPWNAIDPSALTLSSHQPRCPCPRLTSNASLLQLVLPTCIVFALTRQHQQTHAIASRPKKADIALTTSAVLPVVKVSPRSLFHFFTMPFHLSLTLSHAVLMQLIIG